MPNTLMLKGVSAIEPKVKLGLSLLVLAITMVFIGLLLMDKMYSTQNFNISKIILNGDAPHVDRSAVRNTVAGLLGGNYFSVDTEKILAALSALPWVESVRLRRKWPDSLIVDIDEYQAIAHWNEGSWLTTKGKLVQLPLPKNVDLPQLNGPSNLVQTVWKRYQAWSPLFSEQGLRLRNLKLSKQHVYRLELEYLMQSNVLNNKGFEIILVDSNAQSQLHAFLSSRKLSMIESAQNIKTVDLRYPSGFSITWYEADELAQNHNRTVGSQ